MTDNNVDSETYTNIRPFVLMRRNKKTVTGTGADRRLRGPNTHTGRPIIGLLASE